MPNKKSKRDSRKPMKSSNAVKDMFSRMMEKLRSRTPVKKMKKSPKKPKTNKSPSMFSRMMEKLSMKKSKKSPKKSKTPKFGMKKSKKPSKKSRKCKDRLGDKIRINMGEFKSGRYKSRQQAIAVSYAQVQKMYPACKRHLKRKKM
jgi:Mg-chelatase subunit ChlI